MNSSQITHRQLVKEAEAARILNVEIATLRRWRWKGRGPLFHKIGAAVRYDVAELESFVDLARRRSTSDPGPPRSPEE